MIRFFAVLLVWVAVLGCSTPVPKTSKPMSFEDSFRRQGRTEYGTPVLNKVPYLNRLFMNTAVGFGEFVWDDFLGSSAAVVSPDGKWLLTGQQNFTDMGFVRSDRGVVSLWSLTDPEAHQAKIIPDDFGAVSIDWLAFTSDSSQFFVFFRPMGNYKPGTLKRYDRATGKELQTISPSLVAQTGAVSPDGKLLVAVTLNSIEVWNTVDGQKVGSIPFETSIGVDTIRFTPDGRLLFVGCFTNEIKVFDLHIGKQIASIPVENTNSKERQHGGQWKNCFSISPDGKVILVIDRQGLNPGEPTIEHYLNAMQCQKTRIREIEIGSWRVLREIEPMAIENVTCEIQSVCFSSEGNKLYGVGYQRTEVKDTEIKSFLGEFDLGRESSTWSDIPYKTLPLHPIGRQLLMYPDSGGIMLTKFYEKMSVDFDMTFKKD